MPMPKTPINKNCFPLSMKDKVRRAYHFLYIATKSNAEPPKTIAHRLLRRSIAILDARHNLLSFLLCELVH